MDYGHTRFLFGLLLIIFLLRVRPILLCSESSIEARAPDTLWTEYWIPFLVSVTTLCWAWRSVLSVATLKNQILQCCKKEHDDVSDFSMNLFLISLQHWHLPFTTVSDKSFEVHLQFSWQTVDKGKLELKRKIYLSNISLVGLKFKHKSNKVQISTKAKG